MESRRIRNGLLLGAVFAALLPAGLSAQQDDAARARDVERLAREGMVEVLLSRFRGGRTPEELRLIALATANKAARVPKDRARQRAFQDAEARYLTWISAVERDREALRVPRTVHAAAARVAYAGMILSKWAAADLDEFELTAGRQGETARLLELLLKARGLYEQAGEAIAPLAEELRSGDTEIEDQYLALGVYDTIPRLRLDIRFNLAWANLYIGIVDSQNSARRSDGLRAAERGFQGLVDSGQSSETGARCLLGLAMTLREQGRCDEAGRYFDSSLQATGDGALAAQVRYERARAEIRCGRFEEARITLRPLVEKDPDRLGSTDQPARFYINLAHLWDANSYLVEATELRRQAEQSPVRKALLLRVQRGREIGLRKMNRLTSRGGAWPALAQLFVSDAIDSDADVRTLSAAELLFSARQHSANKQYRHALTQLQAAAARAEVAPELAAEILFELGICHYRCRETREAAEVLARMAREHKDHDKAAQAAEYAYRLWADIAEESRQKDDYLRLAEVLLNLLEGFPEHARRADAQWWLPVALQAGGRYREAIKHFESVPRDAPHWEEAQYRRALCGRLLLDSERALLSRLQLQARATQVAEQLKSYARQAYQRAEDARDADAIRRWSGAALVSAAEVQVSPGVEQYQQALDLLDDFEQRYEGDGQIGRVLAARINAYRGMHRYEQAAQVVDQFLRTVSAEQAGGTLALVARGMQEEVERLERAGDSAAARTLAAQSISTFEQLEAWVKADRARAGYQDAVWYGLARMRYFAGQYEQARGLVVKLLAKDARDGNYQRLHALILTAALSADASEERIAEARGAWGAMLRDPALRAAVPERYWEARFHYLELLLRSGRAAEVENAIRQERVWHRELDGGTWQRKMDGLYERAVRQMRGETGTSQPSASQPAGP